MLHCTFNHTRQFLFNFTSHISSNAYAVVSSAHLLLLVGKCHFRFVIACRSAIKVLRKKPAKQRFGRLSATKELDEVVEEAQGIGKYLVRFSEVGVSMALSALSLKCQVIDASSSGSTNVHPPPSISSSVSRTEQHEQEVDDSDNVLLCHGVQWKVIDGVLEHWRCMPRFGAHILWSNNVDEMCRTPLNYFMLSFPSHMLTDTRNWTSDCLPEGCEKVNEGEILAVFGALYSLTRTSEGRRDLWSTEDGLFPALRFGERYGLSRNRFDILLRCLSFCPEDENISDKWSSVRHLIECFNQRRVVKFYPGWQLCVDESVSSRRGKDGDFCTNRQEAKRSGL